MKHSIKAFVYSAAFSAFVMVAYNAAAATPINSVEPAIVGGGGNLTSFSGNTGAVNNNQWNALMNTGRSNATSNTAKPVADFGNCNSVILRCAQPKCSGGGCTDKDIARSIVSGCVQANSSCKQHGDALIDAVTAQMVAQSTAHVNEQAAATASAANDEAAQQSSQQLQQIQTQMQQMQEQMAQQSADSAAKLEAALAEQQRASQQAAQQTATAATTISTNVSADTLARNQASGQILSKLEDVSAALKEAQAAMQTVFDYAGCNRNGENCTGPARVDAFKQKAEQFFDPFENVQDQVYDALIQAQALGVDITDIYMMLNGSCNVWGKYLCDGEKTDVARCGLGETKNNPELYGCTDAMYGKVAPKQVECQLIQMLSSSDEVQQNWLDTSANMVNNKSIRIACASDALETSRFFANKRNKVDDVGIDDLSMILGQDATISYKTGAVDMSACWDPNKISSDNLRRLLSTGRSGTTGNSVTSSDYVVATDGTVMSKSLSSGKNPIQNITNKSNYDTDLKESAASMGTLNSSCANGMKIGNTCLCNSGYEWSSISNRCVKK